MKIIHVTKTISFLAMLGLIGNVNAQQVVPITSADCGLNLSGNTSYELTEDLSCANSALILSADGTTLSLAGYSIRFSGSDSPPDGIVITGNNNTVTGPGTIERFNNNINLSFANNNDISYITSINAASRAISLINSTENNITNTNIRNSGSQGIALVESNNNSLVRNMILNSSGDGIYLFSAGINPTNSDDNNINNNTIVSSGNNGIYLESQALTSVNNNDINSNLIASSTLQAISLTTSGGFTENNTIQSNFILQETPSPFFSDCTDQPNIWGTNVVNFRTFAETPSCVNVN